MVQEKCHVGQVSLDTSQRGMGRRHAGGAHTAGSAATGRRRNVLTWTCDWWLQLTQHLLYHPPTDRVHMTGGIEAHDAIVWGPKAEQARRKQENDPVLKVTAVL